MALPPTPHILISATAGKAHVAEFNQLGGSCTPTVRSVTLIAPRSGSSNCSHKIDTATPETTAGT